MFVSISHTNPKVTINSIPRDIWIPAIRAKLNSAYYWGNQKQEGGGLLLAKSSVEEIVGLPVQYGIVLDFSAFKRIVDTLEGVEVDVDTSFTDEKYPISGRENDECGGQDPEYLCRYEKISFEKGLVKMDGETALEFVRSRNALGDEGTDLAREKRQQKVFLAIRQKVLSPRTLLSPKKIFDIWKVIKDSIESDISANVGAILIRRALDASEEISTFVLADELLENPPISSKYDKQYVFIPKAGDWSKVNKWVQERLP